MMYDKGRGNGYGYGYTDGDGHGDGSGLRKLYSHTNEHERKAGYGFSDGDGYGNGIGIAPYQEIPHCTRTVMDDIQFFICQQTMVGL
jgi:hypothetical protein